MGGELIDLEKNKGGELIQLEKNAGCQAVLTYLKDYTNKVRNIQEKYALSNKDIMSPRLIDDSKLSFEENTTLAELKRKLDNIINEVALRVENHRVSSYDNYTKRYELNSYDKLRVNSLVTSVQDINKSIHRIKFTFETFYRCNQYIIKELNNCAENGDFSQSKTFVLGNMLLIYELANYLINFLEKFQLDGIDDILKLYQKELTKINTTMDAVKQLRINANSPEIDAKVKEQVISNLNDREESLKLFRTEWDNYIVEINKLQSRVGSLKEQIPTLRLIRDNAQNQLDFFEIMKIFGIIMIAEEVGKNLGTLEIVTLPLHEIELISLPPQKAYTLLGLSQE